MSELDFQVEKAEPVPFAAAPQLGFQLRIAARTALPIQSISLRCQIRIEPARRRYQPEEQERLLELFGEPARWGQTLRPMLWTHAYVQVPSFMGSTQVELPVPCTFDFNIAATKYFYALEAGDVPLCFLFSGTVFYAAADGRLQIAQVPWEKDATFHLPARVWQEMMDHYYPNSAWLRLPRELFDRLYRYKRQHGLATWEQVLACLLPAEEMQGKP